MLILLAKKVLILSELTAGAASATDAAIQKKVYGSRMTTLIISNKVTDDIMKILKYLEKWVLLAKDVSKTIEKKSKKQKKKVVFLTY